MGIKVVKLNDEWGIFVGVLIVEDDDEVFVVFVSGKVVRFVVVEVFVKGCDIMGVVFVRFDDDDRIIVLVKNSEWNVDVVEFEGVVVVV